MKQNHHATRHNHDYFVWHVDFGHQIFDEGNRETLKNETLSRSHMKL